MAKKEITLIPAKIEPNQITQTDGLLYKLVKEALESERNLVGNRLMPLNSSDPDKEADLLSNFNISRGYIFGTVVKLIDGGDIGLLPDDVYRKEKFHISEIDNPDRKKRVLLSTFYFLLKGNYIILANCSNNSIKRIQTYLNWLIVNGQQDIPLFNFSNIIHHEKETTLSEIKSISLGESLQLDINDKNDLIQNLRSKAKSLLENLQLGEEHIDDLLNNDFFKVKIIFQLKNKKKKDEITKKLLQQNLVYLADDNDIELNTKNHGKIKGKDIIEKIRSKIDLTQDGLINERSLEQALYNYIEHLIRIEPKQND